MNNEHKEALQQLLQGANVNIHQLVVGDSTQTIENLIMGDCTQNYYGSSHDEPRLAPDDEEIKQALTELLEAKNDDGKPMMKTKTQWYAVYRVLYEYCNYPKKMTDFERDINNRMGFKEAEPACSYESFKKVPNDLTDLSVKVSKWGALKKKTPAYEQQYVVAEFLMKRLNLT